MTLRALTLAPFALLLSAGAAMATTSTAAADTGSKAQTQRPAKVQAGKAPTQTAAAPASTLQTRDWAKVDLDKDHLVSPAEMEKYLAENPGPLRAPRS